MNTSIVTPEDELAIARDTLERIEQVIMGPQNSQMALSTITQLIIQHRRKISR